MSAKQKVLRQNKADKAETATFVDLRFSGKNTSLILPKQTLVDYQDEFKCILYKTTLRVEGFDEHSQVFGFILGCALHANYTIDTNNVNHTERVEYNQKGYAHPSEWLRDARRVD